MAGFAPVSLFDRAGASAGSAKPRRSRTAYAAIATSKLWTNSRLNPEKQKASWRGRTTNSLRTMSESDEMEIADEAHGISRDVRTDAPSLMSNDCNESGTAGLGAAHGSATAPRILTVLIEYSEERRRVIVRGVWPKAKMKMRPKLVPGNFQNYVDVFEGVDMTWHIGFAGLVPEPEPSDQSGQEEESPNNTLSETHEKKPQS